MPSNQLSDSGKKSNGTSNEEIATPTPEETRAAKSTEHIVTRVRKLPELHRQKNVLTLFLNTFVPLAANDLKRWNSKVSTSPVSRACVFCDKLMTICWKARGNC